MIKLDILDRIALAFFSLWIMFTITNAYSATWNERPVLCEQLFVNWKTKSFTILEFHPDYNSVCVIAFGDDYKQLGISG